MRAKLKIAGLMALLAVSCACEAAGDACPAPANRPGVEPSPLSLQLRTLEPYSITRTLTHYYDAPFGSGFLEVVEEKDQHYYDWMFELELPLWHAPDAARPLGWLMQGYVHAEAGVEKLTGAGMVETEYEHTSLIVWETQANWLRLRLTGDSYVWTHRCHLETARFGLDFVAWETFFRRHADWLHFRKPVPHMLRTSPSADGDPVTAIGIDHKLKMLEIRGDWMEVEVEQPDLTCSGSAGDEARPAQHRGWLKWRDELGPWVYVYTRGC